MNKRNINFVTLFRFNHYGLTTNKFSSEIVRTLSKRNQFSIGRCAKFVGHVRCPTVNSHPEGKSQLKEWPLFLCLISLKTCFTLLNNNIYWWKRLNWAFLMHGFAKIYKGKIVLDNKIQLQKIFLAQLN